MSLTHVAAGGLGLLFLIVTEVVDDELIECMPAFSLANPCHPGAVKVVDEGGVFSLFPECDFINAKVL